MGAQAIWLQQGFQLEFNGISTFVPGLWLSSLLFFSVNAWILGIIITDIGKSLGTKGTMGENGGGNKRSRQQSRPTMHAAKQTSGDEDGNVKME